MISHLCERGNIDYNDNKNGQKILTVQSKASLDVEFHMRRIK